MLTEVDNIQLPVLCKGNVPFLCVAFYGMESNGAQVADNVAVATDRNISLTDSVTSYDERHSIFFP